MMWLIAILCVWTALGVAYSERHKDDERVWVIFLAGGPLFVLFCACFFIFVPFGMLYAYTKDDLEAYWRERLITTDHLSPSGEIFHLSFPKYDAKQNIIKEKKRRVSQRLKQSVVDE